MKNTYRVIGYIDTAVRYQGDVSDYLYAKDAAYQLMNGNYDCIEIWSIAMNILLTQWQKTATGRKYVRTV